jgi:transcriptional regulator with XRE-family HTH domain
MVEITITHEPTVAYRYVGGRKRAMRETAGLTRAQEAVILHRATVSIDRWESGRVPPPIPALLQLCELYGVAPGDFFERVDV